MSGNGGPVASPTQPDSAERVLAESFRAFLRDELKNDNFQQPPKKKQQDLRPLQVVFLIAFAVDITFVYFHFVGSEQNQFLAFLYKLLPALAGTLAVPYLDRLRTWLFEHSSSAWLGIPVFAIAVVLLAMQAPIYAVFAKIDSASSNVELKLDDGTKVEVKKIDLDQSGQFFLPVPKFQSYRLLLRDQDGGNNPEISYPISADDVLTGTLARLPFVSSIFKPRLITAAYEVIVRYSEQEGDLYVAADPTFLLNQPIPEVKGQPAPNYSNLRLHLLASTAPAGACPSPFNCWHKKIESGDAFALPRGPYTFLQQRGKCVLLVKKQILKKQELTLDAEEAGVQASQECK